MIRIRTNRDRLYINCHINKGNTVSFCLMTHFYLRFITFFLPVNNKSIAADAAGYIIYSKFTSRCERHLLFLFPQDWCASER